MSTPFVSGVAALVKSINPCWTNVQIKNIILNNVDVLPSLSGNVSTGGRAGMLIRQYMQPQAP